MSELRAATGHHTKIAASDGDLLSELLDEEDRSGKVEGVPSELQRQLALRRRRLQDTELRLASFLFGVRLLPGGGAFGGGWTMRVN